MADCDGIEAVSLQLYIRDDTGEAPVWIVGFDPETDFVIRPWIVGNREASLPDGAVWAGCKVNANADGCVTLFGQSWPTAARLDETGSGMDQAVFVNLSTLSDMIEASGVAKYAGIHPDTDYSAALIRIKSNADIDSVTHWLNTYRMQCRRSIRAHRFHAGQRGLHELRHLQGADTGVPGEGHVQV